MSMPGPGLPLVSLGEGLNAAPTTVVATRRELSCLLRRRGPLAGGSPSMTAGRLPRFVKRYADIRGSLLGAAQQYAAEVASQRYPDQAHSYA